MAMIRLEVGEQTKEIRKSINELRSFQGCCQDPGRGEELIRERVGRAISIGRTLDPKQRSLCSRPG